MIIDRKTFFAVGEMVQAAAHQHGVVGPVPFTICRPKQFEQPVRTACVSGRPVRSTPETCVWEWDEDRMLGVWFTQCDDVYIYRDRPSVCTRCRRPITEGGLE